MPIEHVISLEYLTYFIVLHCVLAAFKVVSTLKHSTRIDPPPMTSY